MLSGHFLQHSLNVYFDDAHSKLKSNNQDQVQSCISVGEQFPFFVNNRKKIDESPILIIQSQDGASTSEYSEDCRRNDDTSCCLATLVTQTALLNQLLTLNWFSFSATGSVVNPETRNCYAEVSISGLFHCYGDFRHLVTNSTVETRRPENDLVLMKSEADRTKQLIVQEERVEESSKVYETQT